ncbi:MAG TPA: glycosyltransferase [Solirubrobacteraceae bacterium]|nr:glycosyltransferase [Solirubrobacteraceae bacterium]
MRVLIFHGYLLSGTGSNVYNARLAEALLALGHEVHLLCQDRHPERQLFAADERCTIYRPDIGGLLPVYVQDSYEGVQARTFADCSDAEVAAYVQANVDAVREVAERVRPQVALANHLVMGPAILARALGASVPYAVKVHGSALEYTVKPEPERFLRYAREGLAPARTVLVGSTHTARSLWRALEDRSLPGRTRLGPPGVDVERFAPREPEQARAELRALVERLRADAGTGTEAGTGTDVAGGIDAGTDSAVDAGAQESAFARDERAVANALERVLAGEGELVAFVGKLIAAKGVQLLLEAWPKLLEDRPRARLVVVGFGAERELFEAQAEPLGERAIFTGRLEHDELCHLLPLCEALVVPSTFPEAFGMVAVEAAACGALPVSAAHSGLAEVSDVLAQAVPAEARELLSFPIDDRAPAAIAERLLAWLGAEPALRERTRAALVATARERWSWQGVARGVIDAARGRSEAPLARTVG